MAFFLDSDTCIYALKGRYPSVAAHLRSRSPASIKIPAIVKAELLFGARKSRHPKRTLQILERFLFPFEVVPFGDQASESYAQIRHELERKGKLVGPNDLIVAATTLADRGTLVTHNVREFRRIKGLDVEDWTT